LSWSLPYSRNRRYLTGMDWILGALDYGARRRIGLGGFSQAILDLDGDPPVATLRAALDQISNRFPIIHGRVARDWLNLAPYWKIPRGKGLPTIPLAVVDLPEDDPDAVARHFDDHVNKPFESQSQHLRFLLIRAGDRSHLGMVFDHRLLDAFGAEAMFRLIDLTAARRLDEVALRVSQTEPAHLDHWQRRLKSGRTLNHFLYRLNERSVCALRMPREGVTRRIRFLHGTLTAEETAAFNQRSIEEISIPMTLPSAAARAIAAMSRTLPTPPLPGQDWLLFTSASARLPGQEWEKLFFNQFSMMTFSSESASHEEPAQIALKLRDQVFEQMKLQIPFVMQDAGALGRICPHWIGSRLMRLLCDGRFCSFYFACLKDAGFTGGQFLGVPVLNLYHKPLVFAPPGLNICMTTYGGRFNLVMSYVEDALSDAVARRVLREFKSLLLR
jgi:hypothetical protein